MWQSRREFIRAGVGTAMLLAGAKSLKAAGRDQDLEKLTILYTNDQHSRIEPFPDNDPKFGGEGGFAKRAGLIERIRKEEEHVLLLDAGDIFQGTPYFNFFKGELEYKLMSMMQYDAVTFGNHDFDLGCENIARQMPHASFDFVNCNYELGHSALASTGRIYPYRIYKKGGLRVGVMGVGIDLSDLLDSKYVKDVGYLDPVERANHWAAVLRHEEKCDLVICLSHLGYHYDSKKVSDKVLAAQSEEIDLIIGGHTHTFMEEPAGIRNSLGREVMVTQVGWAGIWLGRSEFFFEKDKKNIFHRAKNHRVHRGK